MSTEVYECANGNLKQTEVEPLGEIKEELKKPVDLHNTGDANGNKAKGGRESVVAEKDEPLTKNTASEQKHVVNSGEDEEDANEPQDGDNYSSEEEEDVDGEGDEEAREGDEAYEDEDDYANDGEDDEGEDDESEPPSKRRK